jgi:flavin reductase (DIM6/NTAB) family NADH-FMN oxidoreductase RutF
MTPAAGDLTPDVLKGAFATFPSGITAVAAIRDGRPRGLAASSFTSVSLDPPLVSVCIARTSTTWPALRTAPRLGLSVLAQEHGRVARSLAARGIDRFADVSWECTPQGAVFVDGSALWLDCTRYDELPAGDHEIVLLCVQQLWTYPEVSPLVFHGSKFRQLRTPDGRELTAYADPCRSCDGRGDTLFWIQSPSNQYEQRQPAASVATPREARSDRG